jgi:hypothetical protein
MFSSRGCFPLRRHDTPLSLAHFSVCDRTESLRPIGEFLDDA